MHRLGTYWSWKKSIIHPGQKGSGRGNMDDLTDELSGRGLWRGLRWHIRNRNIILKIVEVRIFMILSVSLHLCSILCSVQNIIQPCEYSSIFFWLPSKRILQPLMRFSCCPYVLTVRTTPDLVLFGLESLYYQLLFDRLRFWLVAHAEPKVGPVLIAGPQLAVAVDIVEFAAEWLAVEGGVESLTTGHGILVFGDLLRL